ncbi:glycosyltransferase [Corynebacterium sp. S7]
MIERYKSELGHEQVYYGEYGANPVINNPIGSFRHNLNKAFFAGSYPERYPERCADMNLIFSAIPETAKNLVILDRNFESQDFGFPAEVQSSILGPVPHGVLQKMHRLFRWSLNFNSIKDSPTMCAMRVYELQAQGKPIISNYARSVFNKFPAIRIVANDTSLGEIESDDCLFEELESANHLMNELFASRTSFHVVGELARLTNLPPLQTRNDRILVVALGDWNTIEEKLRLQKGVEFSLVSLDEFRALDLDASEFGYVAAMREDLNYESEYLLSRKNVFTYTDSLFATQGSRFVDGEFVQGPTHEFVDSADERELTMVSTDHPDVKAFVAGDLKSLRGKGYSADPFGVGYVQYVAANLTPRFTEKPLLTVIIPVYNNGAFLSGKCIPSLRRNKLWSAMEILLIDDGSSDESTVLTCMQLQDKYQNIRVHSFGDGGSGSASRPRNKGVELATADLVTFLDPDNEISTGGYDNLYEEFVQLEKSGVEIDAVSGYQVKVTNTVKYTGRHTAGATRLVDSARQEFFEKGKFPVVSTQASVIRKAMLTNNNIRFVEKALGQDTLYGWEVLATARKIAFVDTAYIVYYADRSDSVTNKVDPEYFAKSLELERAQVSALEKLDLLEIYKDNHLDNFIRNWYLVKLRQTPEDNQASAKRTLQEIAGLYGADLNDYLATV